MLAGLGLKDQDWTQLCQGARPADSAVAWIQPALNSSSV